MKEKKVKFCAKIEKHEGMDAAYVVFPYNVMSLYGVKGQVKVKALIDETIVYRGSLANMGMPCHLLGITKEIREKINKTFGDYIDVQIERDNEIREIVLPGDVADFLNDNPSAKENYNKLSYSHKKEYISWIEEAKKDETRLRRIVKFIDKMNEQTTSNEK